jgi:hypothetical protein
MRFSALWDRQLRITTTIVTLILLGVGIGELVLGAVLSRGSLDLLYPFLIAPIIMVGVVATSWGLAPRGFLLDSAALIVERALRPIRIPLDAVRAVSALPQGMGVALRVGGNSGLFGYYGRFWSSRLGSFRLYATRRTDLVRVETNDDLFVLSPAEPDRFLKELLSRAPHAQMMVGDSPAFTRKGAALRILGVIAGIMAGIAILVGGIFAAIFGFAPISVRVDDGAVRIDRRWASTIELPLTSIRMVTTLAPQYGRRWWRTNGTALGAIRYGRFASQELGSFRLYAWRYGPYVLLETTEGRIILTPDEPEQFVKELAPRLNAHGPQRGAP